MEKFTTSLKITSYMTDIENRLRASSFMELAQEAAGSGADALGFGDKALTPLNAVWVLARMHIRFEKTPRRNEEVVLKTWHKGLKGIQFIRDYQMTDQQDNALVSGTSSWLVMEIDQRKLLYGDTLAAHIPAKPQCEDDAISTLCPKIMAPADSGMALVENHVVRYSDVDCNRHANNTRYIQWAMDIIPEDIPYRQDVHEVFINFNKEAHPGETVALYRGCSDGCWYVEGKAEDGQQIFISKITFKA